MFLKLNRKILTSIAAMVAGWVIVWRSPYKPLSKSSMPELGLFLRAMFYLRIPTK